MALELKVTTALIDNPPTNSPQPPFDPPSTTPAKPINLLAYVHFAQHPWLNRSRQSSPSIDRTPRAS